MKYILYLKSHNEESDTERETEASSFDEAINIFVKELEGYGWPETIIRENTHTEECFEDNNKCNHE